MLSNTGPILPATYKKNIYIYNKTSLSAIWLDVANAYGSVPHRLIYFALKLYGVSEKWIKIIQQYYGGIWSKCFQEFSPSS